jgi:hypothetical protein
VPRANCGAPSRDAQASKGAREDKAQEDQAQEKSSTGGTTAQVSAEGVVLEP